MQTNILFLIAAQLFQLLGFHLNGAGFCSRSSGWRTPFSGLPGVIAKRCTLQAQNLLLLNLAECWTIN